MKMSKHISFQVRSVRGTKTSDTKRGRLTSPSVYLDLRGLLAKTRRQRPDSILGLIPEVL